MNSAVVDVGSKTVTVPATLHLAAFLGADPPGHHLVTWTGGRAKKNALLLTPASDTEILDALERLGGTPGDTLTPEAWTKRADPNDPAADARATGAPLTLTLILPDGTRRPVTDLVHDQDQNGYAWRLAGNRALIKTWRSGCVVCLQSCPGAKVANQKATMRDLHAGKSRFAPSAWAKTLGEGAKLKVELKLSGN